MVRDEEETISSASMTDVEVFEGDNNDDPAEEDNSDEEDESSSSEDKEQEDEEEGSEDNEQSEDGDDKYGGSESEDEAEDTELGHEWLGKIKWESKDKPFSAPGDLGALVYALENGTIIPLCVYLGSLPLGRSTAFA